jgi:hypothetical protein
MGRSGAPRAARPDPGEFVLHGNTNATGPPPDAPPRSTLASHAPWQHERDRAPPEPPHPNRVALSSSTSATLDALPPKPPDSAPPMPAAPLPGDAGSDRRTR